MGSVRVARLGIDLPVISWTGTPSVQELLDSCQGAVRFHLGLGYWVYAAHRTSCGDNGFRGVDTLTTGDVVVIDSVPYEWVASAVAAPGQSYWDAVKSIVSTSNAGVLMQTSLSASSVIIHWLERLVYRLGMPTPRADGPDTSHWQTYTGQPFDPAWRLHSIKCSEGERSGDKTFPERWQMLRDLNVEFRGAYHWLRSDSTIANQAKNLCARIDAEGGLLKGEFIQSDWETTPGIALVTSTQETEFRDRVRQHFGRDCTITYSSDWLPDSTLDPDSRAEFEEWREENPTAVLWYANYNTGSRPQDGWAECAKYNADIWQWTSTYQHPAFEERGGLDMNHVFNWETLIRISDQGDSMGAIRTGPERAYDSRPGSSQANVDPALASANASVPKTKMEAGESRRIMVGTPGTFNEVFVRVTTIGSTPGFVTVSNRPGDDRTSIGNVDADGVDAGGGPIWAGPEGAVYVYSKNGGIDVAVDVFSRV